MTHGSITTYTDDYFYKMTYKHYHNGYYPATFSYYTTSTETANENDNDNYDESDNFNLDSTQASRLRQILRCNRFYNTRSLGSRTIK